MKRSSIFLLVGALFVSAVGCGGDSREYAVPKKLCGAKVDPDLLAPLLPAGEKMKMRKSTRDIGETCSISVVPGEDRGYVPALDIKRDSVTEGDDPLKVMKWRLIRSGNPKKVDIGDDARIADSMGLVALSCPPKGKDTTLAVEVDLSTPTPKDVSERRKALERFLRSYLPTAAKAHGCRS
ncbi:hypothetical protein [Streptomyces sp. RTd22]|uniref:hypothetical protein n=2 Tax=Streptomyces sp. RTd22 TaxID=1841249 RepID=UPI0007C4A3CE|nr:hypothetical protein [Streptomyces sp. RTd22]